MISIRKRTFALVAVVMALVYISQNYTLTGLQGIRFEKLPSQDAPSGTADRLGWDLEGSGPGVANSSLPAGGGGFFQANQTANSAGQTASFASSKLPGDPSSSNRPVSNATPKIRIATFNLHSFSESKLKKQPVVETLARIIRQFDVIALQHIDTRQIGILPALIDRINMSDRRYEFCVGPRVGGPETSQQFAFVFDADRIETDREQLYTVDDPQNLMEYDPLVGWFRVRMVQPAEAFTFSLVNVRVNPNDAARERSILPDLIRSIRQDGRLEDDIIVAGDFSSSSRQLQEVPGLNMMFALEDVATTVSGEFMLDNILFPARATDEFTGRAGVIDFLRQLNLSYDQAMQLSSHMPVWAEFSAYEGGVGR